MSKGITEASRPELTDGRPTQDSSILTYGSETPDSEAQFEPTRIAAADSSSELLRVTPIKDKNSKQRFGLPPGFVARLNRYGRTILFADNVYRLPNGSEFIPQPPAGTLGSRNHQYALVTPEQYEQQERGSIYIRSDGRIFDYALKHNHDDRDLFDTGYTIHDLERTGRYAPKQNLRSARPARRKKARKTKSIKALAAGK